MNYLNNHEIGQERMQQFVNEAETMRRIRKLNGKVSTRKFTSQIRTLVFKALSTVIR